MTISEIKRLREKMKAAAEEARGKEDLFKQLVSENSTEYYCPNSQYHLI